MRLADQGLGTEGRRRRDRRLQKLETSVARKRGVVEKNLKDEKRSASNGERDAAETSVLTPTVMEESMRNRLKRGRIGTAQRFEK